MKLTHIFGNNQIGEVCFLNGFCTLFETSHTPFKIPSAYPPKAGKQWGI